MIRILSWCFVAISCILIVAATVSMVLVFGYHWKPFGAPYWENSVTKKVHVSGCRYYDQGVGGYVRTTWSGSPCRICLDPTQKTKKTEKK